MTDYKAKIPIDDSGLSEAEKNRLQLELSKGLHVAASKALDKIYAARLAWNGS